MFNDPLKPGVVSINISQGGIPKRPVLAAFVTERGLDGDGHHHEKHNSPLQAVCLQDIEKLKELSQAGYLLFPGMTGENLTVKDLHVNALPAGTMLEFSGGVCLELTKIRKPCYVLDSIHPRLKDDILGRCGCYAKVIQGGWLNVGETIKIFSANLVLSCDQNLN